MGVLGTENRAYEHSEDVVVPEPSSQHVVQIDDYDSADAINMINNSYEYYSKLSMYGDATSSAALRDTEEALESIMMNNSYCLDLSEEDLKAVIRNSTSSISIDINDAPPPPHEESSSYYGSGNGSSKNTFEEYCSKETNDGCKSSYEEFCSKDYDGKPPTTEEAVEQCGKGKEKLRSSSQCSTDGSCSEIVTDTNLGRIYYNCNRIDPRLPLNVFDTSLTDPVPVDEEESYCSCSCQSSSASPSRDIVIGSSNVIKEKALVEPVKTLEVEATTMDCCKCSYQKYETQILTRSITEQSLKSTTEDLPSYRSLIAFRLLDSPPNYESVTGIKVNVDEVSVRIIFNSFSSIS